MELLFISEKVGRMCLAGAVFFFGIYWLVMFIKNDRPYEDDDKEPEEFDFTMDDLHRMALHISRHISAASEQRSLWQALGMINKMEKEFHEDTNTYFLGKELRDQYDRQIMKIFQSARQAV